jgi:hypothetical protein
MPTLKVAGKVVRKILIIDKPFDKVLNMKLQSGADIRTNPVIDGRFGL